MSNYVVAGLVLSASLGVAYAILRRPIREICEELGFEKARQRFRQHREWLEASFVLTLAGRDPEEGARWYEEADWRPEVSWARDRQTRVLMALAAVRFDEGPFSDRPPRLATALFEYRDGRWSASGRWIDDLGPDQAVLTNRHLEPVIAPSPRRPTGAGGPTA